MLRQLSGYSKAQDEHLAIESRPLLEVGRCVIGALCMVASVAIIVALATSVRPFEYRGATFGVYVGTSSLSRYSQIARAGYHVGYLANWDGRLYVFAWWARGLD